MHTLSTCSNHFVPKFRDHGIEERMFTLESADPSPRPGPAVRTWTVTRAGEITESRSRRADERCCRAEASRGWGITIMRGGRLAQSRETFFNNSLWPLVAPLRSDAPWLSLNYVGVDKEGRGEELVPLSGGVMEETPLNNACELFRNLLFVSMTLMIHFF